MVPEFPNQPSRRPLPLRLRSPRRPLLLPLHSLLILYPMALHNVLHRHDGPLLEPPPRELWVLVQRPRHRPAAHLRLPFLELPDKSNDSLLLVHGLQRLLLRHPLVAVRRAWVHVPAGGVGFHGAADLDPDLLPLQGDHRAVDLKHRRPDGVRRVDVQVEDHEGHPTVLEFLLDRDGILGVAAETAEVRHQEHVAPTEHLARVRQPRSLVVLP